MEHGMAHYPTKTNSYSNVEKRVSKVTSCPMCLNLTSICNSSTVSCSVRNVVITHEIMSKEFSFWEKDNETKIVRW